MYEQWLQSQRGSTVADEFAVDPIVQLFGLGDEAVFKIASVSGVHRPWCATESESAAAAVDEHLVYWGNEDQ